MPLHCIIKNAQKGWARVPKEKNRRSLWLAAINLKDFVVYYDRGHVCPKHVISGKKLE